ncbi:MAG: hypothetical protein JWR26_1196 [Pedosphaera sp.]|nr:hypothetical protein [Pedosphaera sp.]
MRPLTFSLVISVLIAVSMHFIPVWADDFYGTLYHGTIVKVFPRGWPIKYVFEGEFQNSIPLILLKISANVLICWTAAYLLMLAFGRICRKMKKS